MVSNYALQRVKAWAIVPLFDNSIMAASGGHSSPSSSLSGSVPGSSLHDGMLEPIAKITLDKKLGYSSGSSVLVEISNLNKVKESHTADSLQNTVQCVALCQRWNVLEPETGETVASSVFALPSCRLSLLLGCVHKNCSNLSLHYLNSWRSASVQSELTSD